MLHLKTEMETANTCQHKQHHQRSLKGGVGVKYKLKLQCQLASNEFHKKYVIRIKDMFQHVSTI